MKRTSIGIIATYLLIANVNTLHAQNWKSIGKKIGQKVETYVDKSLEEKPKQSSTTKDNTVSKDIKEQSGPFENLQRMRYDYERGTENIFADDFSKDVIGEMATQWTSNGRGIVQDVDMVQGKWLELFDGNTYKIKSLVRIPENFTVEFDVLALSDQKHQFRLDFGFDYQKGVGNHYYLAKNNPLNINASYWFNRFEFNTKEVKPNKNSEVKANMSYFVNDIMKVKIHVEGERMRTYINEYKILDTEMVDPMTKKYFYLAFNSDDKTANVYISNFRIDKI